MPQRTPSETAASIKKSPSTSFIVDDLSSIFGGNILLKCDSDFQCGNYSFGMSSKASFFNDISLQKLLHYLGNFRKLKGKVKKDEEPDWDVNKGLRSVRCVTLSNIEF